MSSLLSEHLLSEEYAQKAIDAWATARERALQGGHYVVFQDETGRFVKEDPDGRRFEVRFHPDQPCETHMEIVRELTASPTE